MGKTIGLERIVSAEHIYRFLSVYMLFVSPLLTHDTTISPLSFPIFLVEVYPRPDGTIYICGVGGSDYISKDQLKQGAFRETCEANPARTEAAQQAFVSMSSLYEKEGQLDRSQACMRPCPPDALPYMGQIPLYEGAYINAGHNCWGICWAPACGQVMAELILEGGAESIDLSPFDPARFAPARRGGRGRKRQGTNVGEQW